MAAGKWNFKIEQGATFDRTLTYKNKDKTLINLTGYTAKMQVRASIDEPVLVELSTTNNRITLGGSAGTIRLVISATDTGAFTWTGGVYSLELTSPDGTVTRLLQGNVQVDPEITR